eukprot:6795243-Lingulodinium_polyedra.AAC.1
MTLGSLQNVATVPLTDPDSRHRWWPRGNWRRESRTAATQPTDARSKPTKKKRRTYPTGAGPHTGR